MSSSSADEPKVRLRPTGYAELLGIVPYLLGYHPNPHGDLLVLGLRGKRVVMHARPGIDVPPDGQLLVAQLLTSDASVNRAVVIGYATAEHLGTITAMQATLSAAGLHVTDVLRVDGDRFFCLRCDDCLPTEGGRFDPTATVIAAEATVAGLVALPHRNAMVDRVAYRPDGADAMRAAIVAAAERLVAAPPDAAATAAILDELLRHAENGARLDDEAAATLMLLLQQSGWRAHVWLVTTDRPWQLDLWCDLTRRCPPDHVAPVACLAAWTAWRGGDTVTAGAAVDRALAASPGDSIAVLIRDLLDRYVPPASITWPPDERDD